MDRLNAFRVGSYTFTYDKINRNAPATPLVKSYTSTLTLRSNPHLKTHYVRKHQ